ncbi:filamentous hemagglutinin N-terminal domain-containing protein [Roseomonas sp. CAU 1739]|uniref:two-partner secretion domain-containing protein n=1 Tax=Roseomonas sp. CAU 1739 TaxID=3140364 RepID=UPI00325BBD13
MARPARRRATAPVPAPARAPARVPVRRWWLLATTALLPVTGTALAQSPTGGQVVAGQAAIAQSGNRTTITQGTNRAAIDWQQFNVGSQSTVQFVQPNQGSWTLNRVTGPDPSVIAGRIQANGGVAIVNQSGMVFAGGAQVDVGSLIASAANITNNNFMAGRMVFDGAPRPGARVENHGTITVADRGLAALVGPGVSNSGVIRANLGRVALGAAETFVLDLAGDGLIGIDVTRAVTTAPGGGAALVTNSGVIEAAGGSVLLSAHAASGLVEDLVRNTGRIEANSVGARTGEVALRAEGGGVRQDGIITVTGGAADRGGRVALQATGQVTVGAAARIDASGGTGGGQVLVGTTGRGRDQTMAARTIVERGATIRADATRNGNGGEIVVNSSDRTEMRGTLTALGGATGGNGGFIEVSGQSAFVLDGIVDLRAPAGDLGTFLLDPRNIFIADTGTALGVPANSVTETPGDLTTVGGSVTGAGAVSATSGNNTDWVRITPSVITSYAAGNITLEASRQIIIGDAVNRTTAGDLTLRAGLAGAAGTGNITQRTGANISVNGVLTMETAVGAISLGANLRATGVVLSASGNIAQTAGTIAHRTAGTELPLTVNATGGTASVTLARAGNGIFALGASSAMGDFTLSGTAIRQTGALTGNAVALTATTGALTLEADIRATSLTLAAVGNISQTGGTIDHSTAGTELPLTAVASGATSSVSLTRTGNGTLALGASSAGADFALSGDVIRQTGALAGNTVSLAATTGAVTLEANLRATDLTLTAVTGIAQTGGTIAHRTNATTALPLTASVSGTGDIVLDRANGSLQLRSGGTTSGAMQVASAERIEIASGQTVSVAGAADLTVTGAGNALVLGGSLLAESVTLAAAGDITQTGGSIAHVTAGTELPLTVNATGGSAAVDLTGATNGTFALGASGAAGDFALAGEAIRLTGALTGDAVALTATTGALALDADVRATQVALSAVTGISQGAGTTIEHRDNVIFGLPLTLSVSGTGDIVLDQANGNVQLMTGGTAAGLMRIGSSQLIELVTGQTVSVAGATTLAVTGSNQALTLNGSLFTDSLTLSAQGDITQGANGLLARRAAGGGANLTADLPLTVTATGNGHAISLSANNGPLQVLGATTDDGSITLRGRRLTIAGAVTAEANGASRSDVALTSTVGNVVLDGAVTGRNATIITAGDLTQSVALDLGGNGGGRLRVRGPGGGPTTAADSITLTEANAVTELDARATGALAFTAAGDLQVTQARGNGVTLVGGALTVPTGTVDQSGIVATGTGNVAVIADSLTVPGSVSAPNGQTIALRVDALDLSGGSVSAGSTGTVEIGPRTATNAVQIGTAGNPANTVELAAGDLEAITAGTLRIGRTTIASEATATITANGLSVVDAVAPTAALSLLSANGITVSADVTAPSVRMQTTTGDITLGAVSIQADGPGAAITLLSANAITQAAGGVLVSPGGTTVDLVAHAQSGIALAGTGDFRLAGGETPSGASGERSLYSWYGISFATTGTVTVAAPVESLAAATIVSLSGGALSIEAPIITSAGSQLNLTATGNGSGSTITQTAAGTLSTGMLALVADGAIDLSLAPNVVGSLLSASFTDAFGYRSTTGFTVAGALAPSDAGNANITIVADTGNILLQAPIGAGTGTVRLEATTGDVLQDAAGAAITAGRLQVTAGGDALLNPTLAADRNAVGVLGAGTVGGTLAFNATGNLALDGTIAQSGAGGTVRIEAGGTLTQNAGGVLGFDNITLVAPGQMTLRGTIGVDQATPVSVVRLGTDAGITQEAGGRIVADSLGILATGDVLLTAGSNDVRRIAASTSGVFALDTNGALATASLGSVPRTDGTAATVAGVLGSSVTLSAADLTINPAGLGLLGAGAFASAADGVLTLRADALALNGPIGAGNPAGNPTYNGTIAVAPRTLGREIVIGGTDPAALALSAADIFNLVARNIVIGRSEAGAGGLTVAGAVAPQNGVNTVLLQGGAITLVGTFTLPTVGGELTLRAATGDITQGSGSVATANLFAEALAGSVLLDGTTVLNQVGRIAGAVATGEDFAFRGAGSYIIAAPGILAPDGTVTLIAPSGGITQSLGAPITTGRLTASAQGAVVLDGGGATAGAADINHVATLGPSDGSSVTLRNADALTVEGVTANGFTGSTVVLEAPTLTLTGDVTASTADGRVILRSGADFDAPGGGSAITQTGGVIRTRDLSASAEDIDLARNNEVTRLAAGQGATAASTDSIVLRDGGTLSLTDAVGGIEVAARINAGTGSAVQVRADGLTVAPGLVGTVFLAPGGVVRFLPFTAGATIGLGGSGDTTTYATSLLQRVDTGRLVIGSDTAGAITLRQALDLTAANGPAALELRSGADILAGGFNLSLREVSAFAGGNVLLGTAGSAIQRIAPGEISTDGIQAGGTVAVTTGGTLAVDAAIRADGATIALQAADIVLAAGADVQTGAVTGSTITIRSTNAAGLALGVTDAAAGLSQAEIALLDAQGGRLRLEGASIDLAGTVAVSGAAAGVLDLAATGAVTQSAGTLAAASLRVDGASVQIDRAGNTLPQIQATATGNVSVATTGATTVAGTRSTNGNVTISAGSIALSDAAGSIAVRAAGTADLTATAGSITGTTALAAVQATTLNATASGAVTLTGDNAVGTLTAIAGTGVTFDNTLALTAGATGAGGTAIAGNVTLSAPSLRLNDVLATGTADLTASAGTIDQAAGVRLAAGTLRANATGSVILDGANPDGTARNQVQDIDALSAGGAITLRNALALTLDLPLSVGAGQVLTLEAPTLTIGDNLSAGAGGRIILRTGSFNGGVASGGDITQTGGTISTPQLAALAGGAVSLDRTGNAIGTLGGGRSAAGVDLGLGLRAGTSGVLRSTGFGGSTTLGVTGALDIGSGGSLLLRADDFAIAAAIRVPSGTVTLLPYTAGAGIGYVLGGASGSATAGRITLDSTELSFFPTGTPAAELILGALGVTGNVDIAGTVSLATAGATPRVNQLTLIGDGALTQAAGTTIDVAALRAIFPNGAVLLDPGSAGNRIAALAGIVAGGNVAVRGGAGMMALRDGGSGSAITVNGTGRTVTLRADDLDIQAALQAPGGTFNILTETLGRGITLGGAGAGTLALSTAEIARIGGGGPTLSAPAATRLRIGSDGTLRTAGDIVVAGDVALRSGTTVRVGTLELVAGRPGTAGGSVRQTGGSVDVATITGTAQGDFRLGLAGNAFDAATGVAAGTLPAVGATGVVELGTTGALVASAITAPVSIRLTAGGALSAGNITAPVILLQGGSVALTNLIQGSTSVSIESTGAVTQQAGALIVTGLFTLNGGSISLPEDNQIVELDGLVATGPVLSLNTVLPLLVSGAVSAVGSLNFATDQDLTVAGTGSITVTGGPGSATLTAGGAIDYAGALTTSGAATLTAGGSLAFTGTADVGGTLNFGAGAGMTLAGGIGAANGIVAEAVGALSSTATLSAGGSIGLTAGTTLDLGGSWTAGDATTFTAGGLLTYSATGTGDGNVTLTTPGAITTTAASAITGAGTVRLDAGTDLSALGSVAGGPLVAFTAGTGGMTLGGTIASDGAMTASAGGAIATNAAITALSGDVTMTAGTTLDFANSLVTGGAVTFDATGAMTLTGTLDAAGFTASAGGALTTDALISVAGSAALTAAGAVDASGIIAAGGTLALDAGTTMTIGGSWSAGAAASFTAGGLLTYAATGVGGANITLTTPGAIAASAGSTIDAVGTVRLDAGTTLSALGSVTGGALVEFIAGTGAMTLAGTIGATGDVTAAAGGTLTTTAGIAAGGDVTLTAGGALSASNSIDAGGALALGAGAGMDIAGTWSAGDAASFIAGGLLAYTAAGTGGGDVTFSTPGAITASAASAIDGAGTVRLGAGTTLSALGTITGGPLVDLRAVSGAMTLSGTIASTGDMTATAGAAITTTAAITADGAVSMTAAGALSASNSINAGGALTLDAGAGMDIAGTWSAGGAVSFTAGGLLTYSATGTGGGNVTLATPGGISASAGSAIDATGTVQLDAGTALSALGSITSGALVDLRAGTGAMTLAGTIGAAGDLTAAAGGGLTTTATITSGGDARLTAGGALSASNTLAADGTLTLGAGAGMDLGGSWSAGGTTTITAGGLLRYTATGTAGDDVTISADGGMTASAGTVITTPGMVRINAGLDLTALGTIHGDTGVDMRVALGAMTLAGTVSSGGEVAATAWTGLTTSALLTAGTDAYLVAGGAMNATNRIAAGRDLSMRGAGGLAASGTFTAGRDAVLASSSGATAISGVVTAGGGVALGAGGTLQSNATVQAGGVMTINAGSDMTLATLHRAGSTLDIAAGGGLNASGTLFAGAAATIRAGQSMSLQGLVQAGGGLTVSAGGNLAFAATGIAGGVMEASAGGNFNQSGTLTAAAAFLSAGATLSQSGQVSVSGEMRLNGGAITSTGTVVAGGPITLAAGAGLAQSGYLQSGQAVLLSAGGSLRLADRALAATDFTMTAGGTATLVNGKITAGGQVRLTAGQGATVQSFQIDPTIILLQTGGNLLIEGSSLVSSDSIGLTGGTVTLRGNTITTGTLDIEAGGTLTLDGGNYIIGRAVEFAGPGGITTPSVIVVRPRDGLLPAVLFDTRAAGALPDPLTVVQPDIPGLPANQQATQVRIPGTEAPGAFGPASSAPAGTMQINVDAGRSAVFLLLDGGSATGTVVSAGRIAIHGTGGSAELTGQLVDISGSPVGGQSAARFADSTRPASTGALTRYRINGCVVSSVNCVVPSQVLTIPQAPPQQINIRLGGGAITDPDVQLPNIAEEDY